MIGKSLGSCYKFTAVLPVLLTGINSYKVITNQFFELGLIAEEVTLPYQLTNRKQFPSFGRGGRRLSFSGAKRCSDEYECHNKDAGYNMQILHSGNSSIRH